MGSTTTTYGLINSIFSFSSSSIIKSKSSSSNKTPTLSRSSSYFPINYSSSSYPSCYYYTNYYYSNNRLSSLLSKQPPIRRRRINNNNKSMISTPSPLLENEAAAAAAASEEEEDGSDSGLVGSYDLLIIGPGVLGRLVALQWKQDHPGCQIYGQTVTTDHHDELIRMGISPSLKGFKSPLKFPYVLFCAPPYQTTDYPADIREAALSWNGEGSFLFTSSSAPYDCYDNGQCYEDSPIVPIGKSPRTDVLLKAEKVVLESGGCVLRLAGLYKEDKGAHVYWLEKGNVDARPDHILNLIHYEDAASLSIAIMEKKLRGRIFLGCDNHPLSRQEIMDLVSESGKFSKKFGSFTGTNDPLGKKLNNEKTRKEIGWEPKYPSFTYFLGVS